MIRILIVDDHRLIRLSLQHLLQSTTIIQVIGEASTGKEALQLAKQLKPDVILLDIHLSESFSGIEVVRRLAKRSTTYCKILIITSYDQSFVATRLLKAGAAGYLLKSADLSELISAIETVHAGKIYISPAVKKGLESSTMQSKPFLFDSLTTHEFEIMLLLVRGLKPKEVAELLSLSPKTISNYKKKIYDKLNVKSDLEIVNLASKYQLLEI